MADGLGKTQLIGAQELQATMREFTAEMQNKVTRSSLRKAAKVLSAQIETNLAALDDPTTTERIFANVNIRWGSKRFRSQGFPNFRIGILGGAVSREVNERNPGGDTFYWRFLEFGTEKVGGKYPITNAVEATEAQALALFREDLRKSTQAAAKRIAKKRASRSGAQQTRRDLFGLGD